VGQVSAVLRRGEGRYFHWCPGCNELHALSDGWTFDGNLDRPTFTPSFKQEGFQEITVNGVWTGEWQRDSAGKPLPFLCHYVLTAGVLHFQNDCSHALAGQAVPLPPLPPELRD
jgi:Family of unknown function (DUF6527)